MGKVKIVPLIVSFLIIILMAYAGSFFTNLGTSSDWYQQIKPDITPPNFVFPIVWTILFVLIAISLYLTWTGSEEEDKIRVAWIFGFNFALNILWSALFFGLRNPVFAFIEIIVLWISIWMMFFISWKINKIASWLLVPYLVWIAFASVLTGLVAFA
jgi:tryptophan-rich sensory protein